MAQAHGIPPAIAALLDSVDGEERALHGPHDGRGRDDGSHAFAQVLEDLAANLTTEAPVLPERLRRRPPAPAPLGAPGDLVLVIGGAGDALSVVRSMASVAGAVEIAVAGSIDSVGTVRVDDRRSAVRARAMGVQNASPVFVAFGLDHFGRGTTVGPGWEDAVSGISPDQVWLAVDAGRKPDDTARWVNAIAARLAVDAIAVEGSALTATPDTVADLNLPIGWVDGLATGSTRSTQPVWDS